MNSKDETIPSPKNLQLPEPNLENITALSHNLPNTPIIPSALKESVNAVLRFFTGRYTQSNDKTETKQQPNQAD
ncbi:MULTISPECIES: hypothetical protein [Nostoc]|uniref:Uncharacterized protein n=1 Tax=Nostoc paludosum FACHB-159 TaxID=2692908 RepID=A0ABR8K6D5_9NOSO|nr:MULTISPECIES: hypothetical protein [Nostoc]MBD2678109.1 hypothetical protein [Nostoc sp. FACHB-857]MBD2734369.1 hypothetical protein [Nostoc paludosum FACHB-159]